MKRLQRRIPISLTTAPGSASPSMSAAHLFQGSMPLKEKIEIIVQSMSLILLGPTFESAPVIVPINDPLPRPTLISRLGRALVAAIGLLFFFVGGSSRAADERSSSAPNTPPTISAIDDQMINTNTVAEPMGFTIGDLETPPKKLVLMASSSNPILVPVGNIVFGGKSRRRTVTVTPALDQSGSSIITVTVVDRKGATASEQFLLTVEPPAGGDFTPEQRAYLQTVAPIVTFDRLVYEAPDTIMASVTYHSTTQRDSSPFLLFLVSSETLDMEQVPLVNSDPTTRITAGAIPMQLVSNGSPPNPGDNLLQTKPGEVILAFTNYHIDGSSFPLQDMVSADFALIYNPTFATSPVRVIPGIALQPNEADVDANGKSLATFATLPGAYAMGQAPINELLFAPHSEEQLAEFLQLTGGVITETIGPGPLPEWVTIQVTPPAGIERYLPQFRDMYGDSSLLVTSRGEGLAIYAYGLQLRLEGYQVALNPRFYSTGDAASLEDSTSSAANAFAGDFLTEAFDNPVFGIREMWANMAMWDADLQGHWNPDGTSVQLGILDMGLASNDDWRAPCTTCLPADLEFFGLSKNWHGTSVYSVAGGMLNNGVGSVGTGGQVVTPKVYCMKLMDFASHISEQVTQAVDDGADVINLSAGYPCRFLLSLGTENACTTASRAFLLTKLTVLAALTCHFHIWDKCAYYTALDVFFAAFLITETKGAMEDAVAYAKENGVPLVASAGNKFTLDDLPAVFSTILSKFVSDEDLANTDIDEWQIIPAVIPDVIAVGAADNDSSDYYKNIEFFGESVDIWAPIYSNHFGPPSSDTTTAGPPEYKTGFSGTSAAAPYISGIVSNMMAVNPSLHPHRATDAERLNIVDNIASILASTAYQPDVPESDGTTIVLPDPDKIGVTGDLAEAMKQRRNLVNANKAWLSAANGDPVKSIPQIIPDLTGLGFDADNGHQSDGTSFLLGGGDDVGDSTATGQPLNTADFPSFTDEISFIWPEKPAGLVATDKDYFKWMAPAGIDGTKMYRQKLSVTVPDYAKSLPWLTYWHGAKSEGSGTTSYTFYTPWLASLGQHDFLISTPQYTDTPYRIDLVSDEEATIPGYDQYDTPPVSNDDSTHAADPSSAWVKLPITSAGSFESEAWALNFTTAPKTLTLHTATDVDWFRVFCPGTVAAHLTDPCAPIATIRVVPFDPNIKVSVINSTTLKTIKEGRGSDVITLYRRDYGAGWDKVPLLIKIESFSDTLHTYTTSMRISIPQNEFCNCWNEIVSQDYGPLDPIGITHPIPSSKAEPGLVILDGSRVLRQLEKPVYGTTPTLIDAEGRTLTPRTFLIQHTPPAPAMNSDFWISAFLGHDRDFGGYDQSLRMDLFSVANCTWVAGIITLNGTTQVIYDSSGPLPPPAPYKVGDLDLYVGGLAEGSYILALSYFKPEGVASDDLVTTGDGVDLILGQDSIFDHSPSVEDEVSGSSAAEVTIGPDADNLLK